MSSYIQNYGFTKTLIQDNENNLQHEIKWQGDYDGKIANIGVDINDNGNREFVSMQLNNNDIRQLFGIQPIEVPLEKRLMNDFLSHKPNRPITLEGALIKRKSRRHRKKHHKRRKTRRSY
jgi:hypothetical protein